MNRVARAFAHANECAVNAGDSLMMAWRRPLPERVSFTPNPASELSQRYRSRSPAVAFSTRVLVNFGKGDNRGFQMRKLRLRI